MKKQGNKLPVKSQMANQETDTEVIDNDPKVRPAVKVMNAIGKVVKNGVKPGKKKKSKIPSGPSSANNDAKAAKKGRKDFSDDEAGE